MNATCVSDGCTKAGGVRGLCRLHYRREQRAGTLDRYPLRRREGRTYLDVRGYVVIYEPEHPLANAKGSVLEHRKVMYDSGTDPTGLIVHHVNGIKTDNRLENLVVQPRSVHTTHHLTELGAVRNQFGEFRVIRDPVERRAREAERARRRRSAS